MIHIISGKRVIEQLDLGGTAARFAVDDAMSRVRATGPNYQPTTQDAELRDGLVEAVVEHIEACTIELDDGEEELPEAEASMQEAMQWHAARALNLQPGWNNENQRIDNAATSLKISSFMLRELLEIEHDAAPEPEWVEPPKPAASAPVVPRSLKGRRC